MAIFNFEDPEVQELFDDLLRGTDGSEPCYDPEANKAEFMGESATDAYVENYTNKGISKESAEELCSPCHVKDKCAAYALKAKEPYGVWGGTRPIDRGIPVGYKGR